MSDYTPKVGDRVRATLGETVIVGRVSKMRSINDVAHEIDVIPAEDSFATLTLTVRYWQFEQVVEVPTKFGAVIRRADGQVSANLLPHSVDNQPWATDAGDWVSTDEATDGGFTVLFEGVDE